jgi:FAD/FMN-containing dehydrogenase
VSYWIAPHRFRRVQHCDFTPDGWEGIVEFSPADQVLVVRGGTTIEQLNEELEPSGQWVPYGVHWAEPIPLSSMRVADALSLNLPHASHGRVGSWTDWILGMRLMLADGQIVKTGSLAVKSVAGYDLHRFLVGSRGSFGVPMELFLRTSPRAAYEAPELVPGNGSGEAIRRTLLSDVRPELARISDPLTATSWGIDGTCPLPAHAWQLEPGRAELPLSSRPWFKQAKMELDPENWWHPEEWEPL